MNSLNEFQRVQIERRRRGLCAKCGERAGVVRWGDALALTHGGGEMWCQICALEAQLAHARDRAAAIPDLEAQLAVARGDG